jgi:peptidoglycan lytic transglycosylase
MSLHKTIDVFIYGLVIAVTFSSCTKKPMAPGSASQVGVASWYGHPFDGRPTASGEIYDMEKMTAAHRTLPLGTVVSVQNLVNNQTVQVRINDRGPFVNNRIIDLSHAAAQAISMPGITNVRLDIISTPPTRAADMFAIQVGAFAKRQDADQLRDQMDRKYGTATLVFREGDQTWRVLVGLEPSLDKANQMAEQLDKETGSAFVVRVDAD